MRNALLLLLTAIVWGFAFVAQKTGMENVGAFCFNCTRSIIGGIVLLPVIKLLDSRKSADDLAFEKANRRILWLGGLCCGTVLALASTMQQVGIKSTTVGKAGFITACYIILVPIFGLFLKKSCSWLLWVAVALAVYGLYLLCLTDGFSIERGDTCVLICAVLFALHIMVVDYFAPHVDCVKMSCIQFFTAGILCGLPIPFVEGVPTLPALQASLWPILYAGVMSSGVGYTLQLVGQKNFNPTLASIIMSLESTFAVIGGWLLLGEHLTNRQFGGCAAMFVAIMLAQLPGDIIQKTKKLFKKQEMQP